MTPQQIEVIGWCFTVALLLGGLGLTLAIVALVRLARFKAKFRRPW